MKLFILVAGLFTLGVSAEAQTYDLVIRHGQIIDGTGKPAYLADIAIIHGRIAKIGTITGSAETEIDATGQIVSPGFIDVHTHADDIIENPNAENFLRMGVTSIVVGNCGGSALDIGKLFKDIETKHVTVNVATLIGHNTIREAAMGGSFNRAPTTSEMTKMKAYVDQAMRDGAIGLSTGLIYQPGVFSTTDEIVALAKSVTPYDGMYVSHMRYENEHIYDALNEVFLVAREAHLRAEVSHIKLSGEKAWGQANQVLAYIQAARTSGLTITQDQYSYTASSTTMSQLIPDDALAGGPDQFKALLNTPLRKADLVKRMREHLFNRGRTDYGYAVIASYKHNPVLDGLSIPKAAKKLTGSDSLENQIDIILDLEKNGGAKGVFHGMNENDLKIFMRDPNTMIASDSGIRDFGKDVPHPRGYGNNARVLSHYVRDLKLISLEEAIRKMTSLPAHTFRFINRGELKPGTWADITIFDPEKINTFSTYTDPHHYALGVKDLLINGVPVIRSGKLTEAKPGMACRAVIAPALNTREQLQAQLESYITQPRFDGAIWGVKVTSLDTGKTLFEHNPDVRQSPASNAKLYTAALALSTLRSNYTITTPLLSTTAPDSNGVVRGDLIIAGRGDPSWNFRVSDSDFWSIFTPFITALKQKNITQIKGNIIADATWLKEPPQGASWTVDDMDSDFGAEISGITLADNFVNIRITSAHTEGKPCSIELQQPFTGLTIDNKTTTGAINSIRDIRVQRLMGENILRISGTLPLNGKPELTEATVPNPALWFANCLREALIKAGIKVDGLSQALRWPEMAAKAEYTLGSIRSPTLGEMVKSFLKPSQNLETDLIFSQVGELSRTQETPVWLRTDELATQALDTFLSHINTPQGAVVFDEGSGLSRNDLTTASATVNLLSAMAHHPEYTAFYTALPIAGIDGSLARRMRGTLAAANVHAKTGGLRWASSLSGYVSTAAREKLVFSFMLNRHLAPSWHKSTDDLDQLTLMLAEYSGKP